MAEEMEKLEDGWRDEEIERLRIERSRGREIERWRWQRDGAVENWSDGCGDE